MVLLKTTPVLQEKGSHVVETSETETPKTDPTQADQDRSGTRTYLAGEEAIYERAEYIFKLTDSLIFILLACLSGGIIGFFFAGAFNIAVLAFVSMTLGLLMGFVLWGNKKNEVR